MSDARSQSLPWRLCPSRRSRCPTVRAALQNSDGHPCHTGKAVAFVRIEYNPPAHDWEVVLMAVSQLAYIGRARRRRHRLRPGDAAEYPSGNRSWQAYERPHDFLLRHDAFRLRGRVRLGWATHRRCGLAGGPAPEWQYMGSSLAASARAGAAAGGCDARLTCPR
jgi:hypothetical protein